MSGNELLNRNNYRNGHRLKDIKNAIIDHNIAA